MRIRRVNFLGSRAAVNLRVGPPVNLFRRSVCRHGFPLLQCVSMTSSSPLASEMELLCIHVASKEETRKTRQTPPYPPDLSERYPVNSGKRKKQERRKGIDSKTDALAT